MKKLSLLSFLLMCSLINFGQNPSWIIAPKFLDMSGPVPILQSLPTSPTPNSYAGQPASHVQNIEVDPQGNILFFIVDENIYDREGKFFAQMTSDEQSPLTGLFYPANGVNELMVVPVPGNCYEYFIITSAETSNATTSADDRQMLYGKIRVEYAGNQLTSTSGFYSWNAGLSAYEFVPAIPLGLPTIMRPLLNWNTSGSGTTTHVTPTLTAAVTKLNSQNKRFLFISGFTDLWKFEISSTGISTGTTIFNYNSWPMTQGNQISHNHRGEMEIANLNFGISAGGSEVPGSYRIAYNFVRESNFYGLVYDGILILDLDFNGNVMAGSQKLQPYYYPNLLPQPFVKGLEFSPSGNKLYVTHENQTAPDTNTIDQLDVSGPTIVRVALTEPGMQDFTNSQIERNLNGELYLVNANRMAKIINPENPWLGSNWINNALTLGFSYNLSQFTTFNSAAPENTTFALQDQIDGENYNAHFFATIACCIANTTYDKITYTATTNATWQPGVNANPITPTSASVVDIKTELRIPAGKTVTIKNMTFRFAPGARVIVENGVGTGPGGKLTLDNTTFTNDPSCANQSWQGVEVWGNQTLAQTSPSQGQLILTNNSKIENAHIGALASKRITPNNLNTDNARNGGVIKAINSSFINNQYGVYILKYGLTGLANNLCFFQNTIFSWSSALPSGVLPQAHATLVSVKGVNFRGCDFKVEPTALGLFTNPVYGIRAMEAQFYVLPHCATCPTPDRSTFKDLTKGIYTSNTTSLTYKVEKTDFTNCEIGIHTVGTKNERIVSNTFKVKELLSIPTSGIKLENSSGYIVQENHFEEYDNAAIAQGMGKAYGILVHNSGGASNEIYKNTFRNLKVGGQSQSTNATVSTNPNLRIGLKWKCNTFQKDIYEADLGVNGTIAYHQGQYDNSTLINATMKAARNDFSLYNENPVIFPAHDIKVYSLPSPWLNTAFRYVYINNNPQKLDNYTLGGVVTPQAAQFGPTTITNSANACPSLLGSSTNSLQTELTQMEQEIGDIIGAFANATGTYLEELEYQLSYLQHEKRMLYTEIGSRLLLDESETATTSAYHDFLLNSTDKEAQVDLLLLKIDNGSTNNTLLLEEIGDYMSFDAQELAKSCEQLQGYSSIEDGLLTDPILLNQVTAITNSTDDIMAATRAKCLLEFITPSMEEVTYWPLEESNGAKGAGVNNGFVFKPTGIDIFPNPTEGSVSFHGKNTDEVFTKIELFDLSGVNVLRLEFETTNKINVNCQKLAAGMYLVKISNSGVEKETQLLNKK